MVRINRFNSKGYHQIPIQTNSHPTTGKFKKITKKQCGHFLEQIERHPVFKTHDAKTKAILGALMSSAERAIHNKLALRQPVTSTFLSQVRDQLEHYFERVELGQKIREFSKTLQNMLQSEIEKECRLFESQINKLTLANGTAKSAEISAYGQQLSANEVASAKAKIDIIKSSYLGRVSGEEFRQDMASDFAEANVSIETATRYAQQLGLSMLDLLRKELSSVLPGRPQYSQIRYPPHPVSRPFFETPDAPDYPYKTRLFTIHNEFNRDIDNDENINNKDISKELKMETNTRMKEYFQRKVAELQFLDEKYLQEQVNLLRRELAQHSSALAKAKKEEDVEMLLDKLFGPDF